METILTYYDYLIEHTLLLIVVLMVMFGIGGLINDYFKIKNRKK